MRLWICCTAMASWAHHGRLPAKMFRTASPRLHILLEADGETKEMATDIDKELCEFSAVYAAARSKELLACAVSYLAPESHLLYRDMQRFRYKTAPDQIKPVHYLDTREKIQFFTVLFNES